MEPINKFGSDPAADAAREMTLRELLVERLRVRWIFFRRRLPYLVWHGQEIDVRVTFRDNVLRADNFQGALTALRGGTFFECEKLLDEVGIKFDTGLGHGGRDWEWDYSLRGPISVTFKCPAKRPEQRT